MDMSTTTVKLINKDEGQSIIVQAKENFKSSMASLQEEASLTRKKRYFSLFLSFVLMHTLSMQNNIYNSSLWPFFSQIDESATEAFFGYICMSFYITSAVTAPFYGMWSNRITQVKFPIISGIFLIIAGNGLLLFAEAFRHNRGWIILASRSISGLGFGCHGLLYTYIVMASTVAERNTAMTMRSVFNGLAVFTGPAVQAMFSHIGYPAFESGPFHLNMYTAASLFNLTVSLTQILVLIFMFKEYWVSSKVTSIAETKRSPVKYDRPAATVCIVMHGVISFSFGFDYSIGPSYVMLMFQWSPEQVLRYLSVIMAGAGILDTIATVFVGIFLLRYIKERSIIVPGLLLIFLFYLVIIPWPGLPPLESLAANTQNGSLALNLSCSHHWCDSMTRIYVWQYILGYILLTLSLAAAFAPNIILFSKILGPTKQGISQGIFAASGYIGSGLGPIIGANVYYYYGPRLAYSIGSVTVLLILVGVILNFKRLVPYHINQKDNGQ